MSAAALSQALALLDAGRPVGEVLALLDAIGQGAPEFPQAQYLRGLCAGRSGDPRRAVDFYLDAIRRGDQRASAFLNLAAEAGKCGVPDEALAVLADVLQRLSPRHTASMSAAIFKALNFTTPDVTPEKDRIFAQVFVPVLATVLARKEMDLAIALEDEVYGCYVRATETEAHFAAAMARIEPLFTKAGRDWRASLKPLPMPELARPYRVGFFIHRASMLAHVEVLLNALKGYRALDDQPFEPIVYCFIGDHPEMERTLAALNVPLVKLHERFPETENSTWDRLLRLREQVAEDGVQEIVWISLVVMLPLVFGMRIAPVQTWFAMKYRNFRQPDIDGYLTGSALTKYGTVAGQRFRMLQLGVDDWYDPALEAESEAIRAEFAGCTILMTVGRAEKMLDPAYLAAVADLLKTHPDTVFLWAGREPLAPIVEAFEAAGVSDRTRFIGWVNTRLYAQVADIFLDSFPFPCTFTLFQAMAAGKPVVIYDSPEAMQTGLWGVIQPLLEGREGSEAERADIAALVGDRASPLISVARDPADYRRLASRLIEDAGARSAAGEASRAFIARFLSDPRSMGRSFSEHLVELIEAKA